MRHSSNVIRTRLTAGDGSAYLFEREERSRTTYGRRYVLLFEDGMPLLDQIKRPTSYRLLFRLPAMLDASGFRRLDQAKLAEFLGTSQQMVSLALGELAMVGAIEREGRGPGTRYRLSPRITWRGSPGAYKAQQRKEGRNYAKEAEAIGLTGQLDLALESKPRTRKRREAA